MADWPSLSLGLLGIDMMAGVEVSALEPIVTVKVDVGWKRLSTLQDCGQGMPAVYLDNAERAKLETWRQRLPPFGSRCRAACLEVDQHSRLTNTEKTG
jgi:hypothetical protein